MASDLQRKLDYILDEKANKIIPYNIRKGVEIFGVSGECVGVDSTDATATPEDIREGKTAYVNDQKITGTYKGVDISDATAKAGDILIGRTAYTANGKTTGQMSNNGILQYTPKAENQDIPAGYTSGGTVKGDANLVAENIKKGTTIFGIEGQAEDNFTDHDEYDACLELANEIQTSEVEGSGWIDTSDATATPADILKDKTAYVNGEKIVGTKAGNEYNALIDTEGLTSSKDSTFAHKIILKELDFTDIDISMFTTFGQAFDGCKLLTKVKGLKIDKNIPMNAMFKDCSNLVEIVDCNLRNCTNSGSMFYNCSKIQEIGDWLDTSQSTYMYQMFFGCTNLVTIPPLNASKLSTSEKAIANMFYNCPKLSDESLNNIMAMCITATSVASGYRRLNYMGLTEEQATRCQSLSNWQTFVDAGWTTGY